MIPSLTVGWTFYYFSLKVRRFLTKRNSYRSLNNLLKSGAVNIILAQQDEHGIALMCFAGCRVLTLEGVSLEFANTRMLAGLEFADFKCDANYDII